MSRSMIKQRNSGATVLVVLYTPRQSNTKIGAVYELHGNQRTKNTEYQKYLKMNKLSSDRM